MVYRFGSVTRVTRQVSLVGFAGFNFYVFVVSYKSLLVHFLLPITLFILFFSFFYIGSCVTEHQDETFL